MSTPQQRGVQPVLRQGVDGDVGARDRGDDRGCVGRTWPGSRVGCWRSARAPAPTSRYYPDTVEQVVAVEPEPSLLVHARAAAAAAPVAGERDRGERRVDARAMPAPFDAMVCSLVLCTVDDPDSVVRQLFSRLRPGGELRYMEHVASTGWRGSSAARRRCHGVAAAVRQLSHPPRHRADHREGRVHHRHRPQAVDHARTGCRCRSPSSPSAGRSNRLQPSNDGSFCSRVGNAVLALSCTVTVAAC